MSDPQHEYSAILERLEAADDALVAALEERAKAVRRFEELRAGAPGAYFELPSRPDVLRRLKERASAFGGPALERVLREVLGACEAMIAPLKVAVLGPAGGIGSWAARRHFGASAELTSLPTIPEVIDEVERRRALYGVVPFETSSDGSVTETIDALAQGEARVCGEVSVPNTYHLVSKTGNPADVEKVYGTAQALGACEDTVGREFPKATLLDVKEVPLALSLAAEDHGAAALVAVELEADSPLRVVRERIEDRVGHSTRFYIVGHERPARTGADRTLLALAVGDGPGALYRALQPFADRNVNLTRIESRAAKGTSWRYLFLLELDGHITDRAVLTTVEEVRAESRHLKVLGSYPRPE